MNFNMTLPGAPIGKGRPRISTRGGFARAYTPQKTRDYEEYIGTLAMLTAGMPTKDTVTVQIDFFYPIPASWSKKKRDAAEGEPCQVKPDLDNAGKLILDALNEIVYEDDKQVVCLSLKKQYSSNPRTEIDIRTWSRLL